MQIKLFLSMFGIMSFRNNGLFILLGTTILFACIYKKVWKKIVCFGGITVAAFLLISSLLTPQDVTHSFQESVGIPLQQVAAVVTGERELSIEQKAYLYRLLPEEDWQLYTPCCVDSLKWHEDFDGDYLNETKKEFLRIWIELLPDNLDLYVKSYLLETFGFWGIETRSGSQYYFKDIFENDLGIYLEIIFPQGMHHVIRDIYSNRFTLRYLSAGTAFWMLLLYCMWVLYKRRNAYAWITIPVWLCWVSLLIATPISFAFRYVFVIALMFPFYLLIPMILEEKSLTDRQEEE